eukprot:3932333-Rhodomonas_salina.4
MNTTTVPMSVWSWHTSGIVGRPETMAWLNLSAKRAAEEQHANLDEPIGIVFFSRGVGWRGKVGRDGMGGK